MGESNGSARVEEPVLTLVQLEASYPEYGKELRILIREGKTLKQIQRTMCWHRLVMLDERIPHQKRDPLLHYTTTKQPLMPMRLPNTEGYPKVDLVRCGKGTQQE